MIENTIYCNLCGKKIFCAESSTVIFLAYDHSEIPNL